MKKLIPCLEYLQPRGRGGHAVVLRVACEVTVSWLITCLSQAELLVLHHSSIQVNQHLQLTARVALDIVVTENGIGGRIPLEQACCHFRTQWTRPLVLPLPKDLPSLIMEQTVQSSIPSSSMSRIGAVRDGLCLRLHSPRSFSVTPAPSLSLCLMLSGFPGAQEQRR
jgi:hypothetical protein